MMTAHDDVLNERLGSINDNVSDDRSSNWLSKADAGNFKKALITRVELMQGNYLSKLRS